MKFRTIPLFIPELACPNRCIYCNQHCISGQEGVPTPEEIHKKIRTYLNTFPKDAHIEVGFFGGNFTGIETALQTELLQTIEPYIQDKRIDSIRISTRPDYISDENLQFLKNYGVQTIELGVQSMDEEVLKIIGRGYTPDCVEKASKMILDNGFDLGLQMMIGLPGDSKEKALQTAKKMIELGASQTRIYPTLVIEGTDLAVLFTENKYTPLSLSEAILICKELIGLFDENRVSILRVGLHPTENFISGKGYLAGPFHVSFKELVLSEIWFDLLNTIPAEKDKMITLYVPDKERNYAIGYHAKNKKMLAQKFKQVVFVGDELLSGRTFQSFISTN